MDVDEYLVPFGPPGGDTPAIESLAMLSPVSTQFHSLPGIRVVHFSVRAGEYHSGCVIGTKAWSAFHFITLVETKTQVSINLKQGDEKLPSFRVSYILTLSVRT